MSTELGTGAGMARRPSACSLPFGFMFGRKGAMTGVGVSIVIAMMYLSVGTLFEKAGEVSQITPLAAAWSPDAVFAAAGLYLFLRAWS